MKKSKADQKKIVARYIAKFEEYSKLSSEELVALQDTKMSSTDFTALRDCINQKMKEEIMNQRLKNAEENNSDIYPGDIIDISEPVPVVNLNKLLDDNTAPKEDNKEIQS